MRVGNWWVQAGLLITQVFPKEEMDELTDEFPSRDTPGVFMTGDGHRTPPFAWTRLGEWAKFFEAFVSKKLLCCHVELYADQVEATSVPAHLEPVFRNGKVFGWEPEIYKTIQPIIETNLTMIAAASENENLNLARIIELTTKMITVSDAGYLKDIGGPASSYRILADKLRREASTQEVPSNKFSGIAKFLQDYNNAAMELRTGINNEIGKNIQLKLDRYHDHLHLITCGNAHIKYNPLYKFVEPPAGTFGIADESQG